jgi:YD repeat-containing protein
MWHPRCGFDLTHYWTVYGYDALGRTTSITLPDGSVSTYSYSGNTTTVTDPAGKWKTYTTDAMGNLTQVTEPAPEGGTHVTTYAGFGNLTDETRVAGKLAGPTVHRNYDPATNRLTLDYTYDANGNMTAMPGLTMTYNVENRLTQATSNLNGTESYGYDAAGLRLWKQGPDGVTHVFYNGCGFRGKANGIPG